MRRRWPATVRPSIRPRSGCATARPSSISSRSRATTVRRREPRMAAAHPTSYELMLFVDPQDWETYHRIRRVELFEARGRIGVYDPDRPDQRAANHFPLLLKRNARGIRTTRLDLHDHHLAVVPLFANPTADQRTGTVLRLT